MKFSAAPGRRNGKAYYKGYADKQGTLQQLSEYAKAYSISSHWYGPGVTAGGEVVEVGHRATGSVVEPGNVVLMDFDKGTIDEAGLREALRGYGVVIRRSKNWSVELEKFHGFMAVDAMPVEDFRGCYRRMMTDLGLIGHCDMAVGVYSAQLAPDWNDYEVVIEGEAFPFSQLEPLDDPEETGSGSGDRDYAPLDAVFTVSRTGEQVGRVDMLERVQRERHIRVHCLDGLEHDGRSDTAFVSISDAGSIYYYCCGGRCGHTLYLDFPFDVIEDQPTLEIETVVRTPLQELIEEAPNLLPVMHLPAQMPRATAGVREAASNAVTAIIAERMGWCFIEGQPQEVYHYTGRHWEPLWDTEKEMFDFFKVVCTSLGWGALAYGSAFQQSMKRAFLTSIPTKKVPDTDKDYLNLRNGTLDLSTGALMPHSPGHVFVYFLDYDYRPEAPAPVWWGLVNRVMMGNPSMVRALQDAMGYLLLPKFNLEKLIVFDGRGRNGKSTVINVLRMIIEGHYSNVDLHTLTGSTSEAIYGRARLAGKMVNFTEELKTKTIDAEGFKNLISGVDIEARHPYGQAFTIKQAPKQLSALNDSTGLLKESSEGFKRRIHPIPFLYTVTERTPNLMEELREERPGILAWLIEGAKRVLANGELSKPEPMQALQRNIELAGNPMAQFIKEAFKPYAAPFESSHENALKIWRNADFYAAYKEFCKDNGYYPLGRNKALKAAEWEGAIPVQWVGRLFGNKSVTTIRGLWGEEIPEEERKSSDFEVVNMLSEVGKNSEDDLPF